MSEKISRLEVAEDYVNFTSRNVFLTGKAGTGKTTFLKNLIATSPKRILVAAPTGVAALNACGATLHSLFQLPFGVTPEGKNAEMSSKSYFARKFKRNKLKLLRSIDMLVIDEVSMVRADTLDAVDYCLRRIRRNSRPFGGVQLLLIGDMNQLPPVAREEDWAILQDFYPSIYFFDSKVYSKADFITIELDQVFRQKDERFLKLLQGVRDKTLTYSDILLLNKRFDEEFCRSDEAESWINLCTHNSMADSLNNERLDAIQKPEFEFEAIIQGEFPEAIYPCEKVLHLKVGARVMFTKNDLNKRFVNGTLGRIVDIREEAGFEMIKVAIDDGAEIWVERADWENTRYVVDKDTQEISQEVIGIFTQFPLRLAWAITIHKSQGLTFDRVIIDAAESFAHGQVYVALSRCRSLDGIILSSQIKTTAIIPDSKIDEFNFYTAQNVPTPEQLAADKLAFTEEVMLDLFDFEECKRACRALMSIEGLDLFFPQFSAIATREFATFKTEILDISKSFQRQIHKYHKEGNEELDDRLIKGAKYFTNKLLYSVFTILKEADKISFDDDESARAFDAAMVRLFREFYIKRESYLWLIKNPFSVAEYMQFKNKSLVKLEDLNPSRYLAKITKPADSLNPATK